MCLNPYSTGRYSVRLAYHSQIEKRVSLNPYSTGRYSVRKYEVVNIEIEGVLILILLEDTL